MDVCCLNRPFDDLSQERIQFESDAVLLIIARCESGQWELVSSEVIDLEMKKQTDLERLKKVQALYSVSGKRLILTEQAKNKSEEFRNYGIKLFDSLHLAVAEVNCIDVFLTTDDALLRATERITTIGIAVANPVTWLMEVLRNERQHGD
jgi:predicted nucleic acid-binding protein